MPLATRLIAVVASAAALLVAPGGASAKTHVAVGLGDQDAAMFSNPAWQALHLKKTRYFIRWNAAKLPGEMNRADAFVDAARAHGVRVLMHISSDSLVIGKGHLPSVSTYKKYVGKLVRHFKAKGVKEWGVWNEANHKSQPTYKSPKRAAQFFVAMRSLCHGCTIVALDVLDQAGVSRYIKSFYAAVPKSKRQYARIVGIHNYSDVNRKRSSGTTGIIKAVKRYKHTRATSQFWLTETGGVVSFGKSFPCSESRAASRTKYMFSLVKKYRSNIKRLYAYNWLGTDCQSRFDAGLTRADGTLRPAYTAFKDSAASFDR
jgi:hypothetical protein